MSEVPEIPIEVTRQGTGRLCTLNDYAVVNYRSYNAADKTKEGV